MFIVFIALAIARSNKTERSLLVKLRVRQSFIFPQVQMWDQARDRREDRRQKRKERLN